MVTTDNEEIYLKKRVAFWEGTFISYKKLLEEFFKAKVSDKDQWEWYKTILTEGRNESKNMLAHCQHELQGYREGMNPPYLYNQKSKHGN